MRALAGYWVIVIGASACGPVSHSDPSLWQSSNQVGNPSYELSQGAPGGVPNSGNGGQGNFGTGGFQQSSGGFQQSSGGFQQSSGGFQQSSGGFQQSSGGFQQSSGGFQQSTGGTVGAGGQSTNSGKCQLTFAVTTVTSHGQYAPNNVGGIWIQDSGGKFVKTLQEWGFLRIGNALAWETASSGNTVDAVTGGTRSNHGPLTASWDCTDVSHNAVVDGAYTVNINFAESDTNPFFGGSGPAASVPFTKGGGPIDTTAPDTSNFTSMHLTYQ